MSVCASRQKEARAGVLRLGTRERKSWLGRGLKRDAVNGRRLG